MMFSGPLIAAIARSSPQRSRCSRTSIERRQASQHRAGPTTLHQPAAFRYQFQAIFQAENAGHASRDIFAEAVPEDRRRLHAPMAPGFCQCILDREQGRLGDVSSFQVIGVRQRFLEREIVAWRECDRSGR